ncbi:penicillin-binding protein 2, partial [Dissulfurirhabdus thermomarina]
MRPSLRDAGRVLLRLRQLDVKAREVNRQRCEAAFLFVLLCVVTLAARLWYLQIVKGTELRARSEHNRVRLVRLQPPRGKLLDRSGRLLVGNQPCFNVCLVREEAKDVEDLLGRLSVLLEEPVGALRERLILGRRLPLYTPIVLKRGIDRDTLARLEPRLFRLPGVSVEVEPLRKYPHGRLASHLLGYLAEVNEAELAKGIYPGVRPGDLVGRAGVEAQYQKVLSGRSGVRRVEVDATGRLARVLDETPPLPGSDLFLTLDLDLQEEAERAMRGKVGAVVALDPRNGCIRAFTSVPEYDLEPFAWGLTPAQWRALNDARTRPLQDKAVQGLYSPGSIFKIVAAVAALETGRLAPQTRLTCTGSFRLGRRVFRCWDRRGHGEPDLYEALVASCDVFFYQAGLMVGVDELARYARAFGFGRATGIALEDEKAGLVPDRAWKLERYGKPWQDGETAIMAIGQGFTLVTPLQLAEMIAAIANGGTFYRPLYVDRERSPSGRVRPGDAPEVVGRLDVRPETLRLVRRALRGVVADEEGTGHACRLPDVAVAGKTATVQVVQQSRRGQLEELPWNLRDHAIFIAYAPAEAPELAVAVLVEHGGHGGSAAAPIARRLFETWFRGRPGGEGRGRG